MKIEREKTVIVIEGNEEHRAVRIAVKATMAAIRDSRLHGRVESLLSEAGANRFDLNDLIPIECHMERILRDLGGG